jgi:hypothetical protein
VKRDERRLVVHADDGNRRSEFNGRKTEIDREFKRERKATYTRFPVLVSIPLLWQHLQVTICPMTKDQTVDPSYAQSEASPEPDPISRQMLMALRMKDMQVGRIKKIWKSHCKHQTAVNRGHSSDTCLNG